MYTSKENNMIYFDNNATTIMPTPIVKKLVEWSNRGNPSSSYKAAIHDRALINEFKAYIARICGISLATGDIDYDLDANSINQNLYRIIFTSCATESNCTIIRSIIDAYTEHVGAMPHVVCSSCEHKATLSQLDSLRERGLIDCTYVSPDSAGIISPANIQASIATNTCLIICMHANNETGAINNIKEIGRIAHAANVPFHCDAVQTFGKAPLNPIANNVDSFSVSFHKLQGPPGVGLLVIKEQLLVGHKLQPSIYGSQNDGMRGGTENLPGIGASYFALKLAMNERIKKNAKVRSIKQYIVTEISSRIPTRTYTEYLRDPPKHDLEIIFISQCDERYLANTILLSVVKLTAPKLCNVKLKNELEKRGVIVSIGSACNTSSKMASHVLYALGADEYVRAGVLRISLGDDNTLDEAKSFVQIFLTLLKAGFQ